MQIAFATVYRNKRPNLPASLPQPLERLVKVCWEADPKKRPPFGRILDSLRAIGRTMERSSSGAASSAGPQRSGLPPTELSRIPLPPRPAQRKAAAGAGAGAGGGGGGGGGGGNPKRS